MRLLRSLTLILATIVLAACGAESTLPETYADLAGTLTEFVPSQASLPATVRVLVEPPGAPEQRAIVQVDAGTRVFIATRGQLVPAKMDDLAQGDQLQVWTTGVELRSLPVQVFATRVHIHR